MSDLRNCTHCLEHKTFDNFGPFKQGKFGLYPVCNSCRQIKARDDYLRERTEYKLYYRAKRRAKIKNLEFTITEKDIVIPVLCPVFQTKMHRPSLDRIDSNKGYTPDNIQVLSTRANVLKNNATVEELEAVVRFLRQ